MDMDLPRNLQRKRALKRIGSFVLLIGMIAFVLSPVLIAGFSSEGITTRDQYASILLATVFFVCFFIAAGNRRIIRKRLSAPNPAIAALDLAKQDK